MPDGIYEAQMRGEMLCPEGEDGEVVNTVLRDMPFWDEFVFTQDSVSHFSVKKKIKDENCCYIDCLHGGRSDGGAALGSEHGSVLFSIRDFWEKYSFWLYLFRNDGEYSRGRGVALVTGGGGDGFQALCESGIQPGIL